MYSTTTGAMKNAFGSLLNMRRYYVHYFISETRINLLTIQREIHSGIFANMDSTIVLSGAGPCTTRPYETRLILTYDNQVAIAAKIMGFDPMMIQYIHLAHEDGLGIGKPWDIEIIGEHISVLNLHF